MVSTAKDVGQDAMPKYLQAAASILQDRLWELITKGGTGEAKGSLKRILDRASQVLEIQGDDHVSSSGRGGPKRVAVEGSQTCRHSCRYHEELMDPSIWGALPREMLYQVFARLPLPKIISLQVLSHEWRREMLVHRDKRNNIVQSEFLKVCDEVHPKVALITRVRENKFWVRLLDVTSNQWHAFQILAGQPEAADITASSQDGGLVCFISTSKKAKPRTFLVDVVNPLTKTTTRLPPLPDFNIVKMVQIDLDPDTRNYKVLVVGEAILTGYLIAKVYDSAGNTKTWSKAKKKKSLGFLYGYSYHWGNLRYSPKRDSPCGYDYAEKSLLSLKDLPSEDESPCPLEISSAKSFALQKDRVFVLQRDKFGPTSNSGYNRGSPAYYILEYRIQMFPKQEWVKIKAHACRPFENPPKAKYDLSLFACKGFLMVFARLPEEEPYRNEVGWAYNLATCKWSDLPKLPGEKPYDVHDLMCDLQWNSLA